MSSTLMSVVIQQKFDRQYLRLKPIKSKNESTHPIIPFAHPDYF
ncbi:MAG: hypothetical protein ACJA08_000393 [Cyclobacteriaceae bacterium]|jgi:hypothetical protein